VLWKQRPSEGQFLLGAKLEIFLKKWVRVLFLDCVQN
jgi:hypothetical protein